MVLPQGAIARDRWLDLADEARAEREDALAAGNHYIAGLWDTHERGLLRNAYDGVPFPDDEANDGGALDSAALDRGSPEAGLDSGDGNLEDDVQLASAHDDLPTLGQFLMAADEPRVTDPITIVGNPDEVDEPQRKVPSTLSSTGAAATIIREQETPVLKKYRDPGGHWTVGTGHKLTDAEAARYPQVIDDATADRLLAEDIGKAEATVRRLVKVPLSQNEFDAMVSYTFNIGAGNLAKSKLLGRLNAGDYEGAAKLFPQSFATSSGKRQPGLEKRRLEEQKLFQQQ